jgi:hypothetical protein
MTDTKNHTAASGSLEGRILRPASPSERAEAVEFAFDYRGDVTLTLASGETVVGYIFNREAAGPRPVLHVFPASGGSRTIPYSDVAAIAFTGEDTASGKSWEAWVAKKESERRAESERVEAEARARGHL